MSAHRPCGRICGPCAVRLLAGWRAQEEPGGGLEAAAFAREANVEQHGLALVESGLRELRAPAFPFQPPSLALVLRLAFRPSEACSPHLLTIRPLTPDGSLDASEATVAIPAEDISRPTPGMIIRTTVVVGELAGLCFDRPGRHAILIFLDGALVASLPLTISKSAPST